jgi:hypothetical protein
MHPIGSKVKYRKTHKEKEPKLVEATIQRYNRQTGRYGILYENEGELVSTSVVEGSLLPLSATATAPVPKRLFPRFGNRPEF